MANAIRALSMDAVEKANSGHPGMPMGMADVATVLFSKFLKFDATAPEWPDRDRFILSAGHGSMLIYSLAYLLGYDGMDIDQLKNFRQLGAKTAGHPEFGHAPAVETTTGPLGQGLANAVGFAMAEAHLAAVFGAELVDHKTYVIAGDGCLMEGISQEAISLAGRQKLGKLIVLWDDNDITIDGKVSMADATDQLARFEASGWRAQRIDGHDPTAIENAIDSAQDSDRPILIACRTTIGKGADAKAGTAKAHGSPLGQAEIAAARRNLDWPYAPFEVPNDILEAWREAGARGASHRRAWEARLSASGAGEEFRRRMAPIDPKRVDAALARAKSAIRETPKAMATRVASQHALEAFTAEIPQMLGGSADLTGSNNTKTERLEVFDDANRKGRYVHYGIREHGMAAAMNGLALHGGVAPYGGTFLVFSDYCRPSIRLAALMGVQSIFVLTHDSIGLGEDGPTHQPVEHLAALRAIPNLHVWRPADAVETAECWAAALLDTTRPSALALSRQNLPLLRSDIEAENLSARGAYAIADRDDYSATILASGSEVHLAIEAASRLAGDGVFVRVVSVPNWLAFDQQPEKYRLEVLGDQPIVAVEAGIAMGWEKYTGPRGRFVGMPGFGASAPAEALFERFDITSRAVAEAVRSVI
ncbi:MAG: transketolase [Alphaproteobacteria bacterium]|nr:transketolase [Alphaproteobacteria bacterium]